MDSTALRVEDLKVALESAHRVAEFHARWRTALLVVMTTLAGSVVVTWLAGQLPPEVAAPAVLGFAALATWQLLALRRLGLAMKRAAVQARSAIGRLIVEEGETGHDEQEADEGGT